MAYNFTSEFQFSNYDRAKLAIMNKPMFSETDWRNAIANGTIDSYIAVMQKSDSIDPNEFYKKYNLYYGDPNSRLTALYAEFGTDRTTVNDYQMPVYDEMGNFLFDEKGNQLFENVKMTEYDYTKKMISDSNKIYSQKAIENAIENARLNNRDFMTYLADVGVIGTQFLQGVASGVENIKNVVGAITEETLETGWQATKMATGFVSPDERRGNTIYSWLQGDESFAETMNKWYTDYSITDDTQKMLDQFAYQYTHFYDENGELTTVPRWLMAGANSLGEMVPTMLLTYATGGVGSGLSAAGGTAATIGSALSASKTAISQLAFYGSNVFGRTVSEQYEYYASQGMSISSAEIVANASVKSALQYCVELGLGKLLGSTGIDKVLYGNDVNANAFKFTNANMTGRAFLNIGKDTLQEGLEEALQDTSDWFVDSIHHFINHDFQNSEWNWQNIADAFVVGMLTSLVGSSNQIVGNNINRISQTGKFNFETDILKTDKNGNLVKDKNGDYAFVKLNPIAAYQYGLDMESYTDSIENLKKANDKFIELYNSLSETERNDVKAHKKLNKAMSQYTAAYYQAVTSFQMLSGLYGEMGQERFNKANEILKKLRQYNDKGFDVEFVKNAQKEIVDSLAILDAEYKLDAMHKIAEAEYTEIDKKSERDVEDTDEELNEVVQMIYDKDPTINKIYFGNGKNVVRVKDILMVPTNLARQDKDAMVVFASDAENRLSELLIEKALNVAEVTNQKNTLELITEMYKIWSSADDVSSEEAIRYLMFEPSFFNFVLTLNEKDTTNYLLRLREIFDTFKAKDNLSDKLFEKRMEETRNRWTQGAIDFYVNNLDANMDDYGRFLKGEELTDFKNKVNQRRALFKTGNKFITQPDSITEKEWEFMERRISNSKTTKEKQDEIRAKLKSNNSVDRAQGLLELNLLYEGAFQTLYNGVYYMPNTSPANMVFNRFLKNNNLNIQTIFDVNYVPEIDKEIVEEIGIFEYRQNQFTTLTNNVHSFVLNKDGKVSIKTRDKIAGWSATDKILKNSAIVKNIIEGKDVEIGTKSHKATNRRFDIEVKSTSKFFRSLLNDDVKSQGISTYVSIDDVINDSSYLKENIVEDIIDTYGDANPDSVFAYLAEEFALATDGKESIVMMRDGSTAIANTAKISELFSKDCKFDLANGKYSLKRFINSKIKSSITDSATVVFGAAENKYVDWEQVPVDGKLTWVFANRIELKAGTPELVRFEFAHELEHLLQFEKGMNAGMSRRPLRMFDKKTRETIIKKVERLAPELFENKPDIVQKTEIVNRYLYYGSGEMQALGLSSTGQLAFYPVLSKRYSDGRVEITLADGSKFTAKGTVNGVNASSRIYQSVETAIKKWYRTFTPKYLKDDERNKRQKIGKEIYAKMLKNKSERTSENIQMALYNMSGFNMSFEEFKNFELLVANIEGQYYFANDIRAFYKIGTYRRTFSADTTIQYGTLKVSEITEATKLDESDGKMLFNLKGGALNNKHSSKIDFSEQLPDISQSLTVIHPATKEDKIALVSDRFKEYFDPDGLEWEDTATLYKEPMNNLEGNFKNLLKQYLYREMGEITPVDLKSSILSELNNNPDLRVDAFKALRSVLGKDYSNYSDESFYNLELPIIRFESQYVTENEVGPIEHPFVSAGILSSENYINYAIGLGSPSRQFDVKNGYTNFRPLMGTFYVTKVKISDLLYYVADGSLEVFVKPDAFVGGDALVVDFSDTGFSWNSIYSPYGLLTPFEEVVSTNIETGYYDNVRYLSWNDYKNHILNLLSEEHFSLRSYRTDTVYKTVKNSKGFTTFKPMIKKEARERLLKLFIKMIPTVERLIDNIDYSPAFRIIPDRYRDDYDAAGWHNAQEREHPDPSSAYRHDISIQEEYEDDVYTLIHELLHFCCNYTLNHYNNIDDRKLAEAGRLIANLYSRVYKLKDLAPANAEYGFTDKHEFVSELVNGEFIDLLSKENLMLDYRNIFNALLGVDVKTVLDALNVATDVILENAQMLDDDDVYVSTIKEYYYNGPVYNGSELITDEAMNTNIAELTKERLDTISNKFVLKRKDNESYVDYAKRLLSNNKFKEAILNMLSKEAMLDITTIYVDGHFVLYDNEVSDYTVKPTESEIDVEPEVKSDTEVKSNVEAKSDTEVKSDTEEVKNESLTKKVKDARQKRNYLVDKREIQRVEYDPKLHRIQIDSLPQGVKKEDVEAGKYKIVYGVDNNPNEPERLPGKQGKYFYRRFLYRIYYNKPHGATGWKDIYEKWYEKDPNERRYLTKDERQDPYIKHFVKGKEHGQMSPGLRDFLLYASTTSLKLPKVLQDKIDGDDAGTLTEKDIARYIFESDANDVSDELFKVFNDCFYENKYIKNVYQLKKYLELLPKIQALYLLIRRSKDKSKLDEKVSLKKLEEMWAKALTGNDKVVARLESYLTTFDLMVTQDSAYQNALADARAEAEAKKEAKKKGLKDYQKYNEKDDKEENESIVYVRQYRQLPLDDIYAQHKLMSNYDGSILGGAKVGADIRIDAWQHELYGNGNLFRGKKAEVSLSDTIGESKEGDSTKDIESTLKDEADEAYRLSFDYWYDKEYSELAQQLSDIKSIGLLKKERAKKTALYSILELINKRCKELNISAKRVTVIIQNYLDHVRDPEYTTTESLARIKAVADYGFDSNLVPKESLENAIDDIYYLAGIAEDTEVSEESIISETKEQSKERINRTVTRGARNRKKLCLEKANKIVEDMSAKIKDRGAISKNLFIKDNKDLFEYQNGELRFKDELLYEYVDGVKILKDAEALEEINSRLKGIRKDISAGAYNSSDDHKLYKKAKNYEKKIEELERKLENSKTSDNVNVIRLQLGNGNTLDVSAEQRVPDAIRKIIELGKAKEVDTMVKQFSKTEEVENEETGEIETKYTSTHAKLVYDNFIDICADTLIEIGQDGANEIVDFYLGDKPIIIAGDSDRIALNIQQLLLGYLYSLHYNNDLQFDSARLSKIENYLEVQSSIGGTWLRNQRTILNMLRSKNSKEQVSQNLIEYIGIKLDDEDIVNLHKMSVAMRTASNSKNAWENYVEARDVFESRLIAKHKNDKRSILEKILIWEQAMMLSSPATWARNFVSNLTVTGGNLVTGVLGENVNRVLNKLLPNSKMFQDRDDQYKIVGTKVSEDVDKFIDEIFVKSKFIDVTTAGLSRYDVRRISKYSSGDNVTDLIASALGREIKSKYIFNQTKITPKWAADSGNWIVDKIFKGVSDSPFIKKKIVSYLKKITQEELAKNPKFKLTTDHTNNLYGINNTMLDLFMKAYSLAAYDYMHTSNWIMEMERQLSINLGEKGYFVYKQLFPFLGTSWNWTLEALRYTPLYLAKSVYNLAKLENTIAKLDDKQRKGARVYSSEFAQYVARRNLGKAMIGTIGWTVGAMLVALGLAGVDEEDEEYKIILGGPNGVKIAIDDVIGSSGVVLGIATTYELFKGGKDPMRILRTVLNSLFRDSVIQTVIDTFRYKKGVGDFLTDLVTEDIPSRFWPNFIKLFASVSHSNGVYYSDSVLGGLQKLAAKNIPFGGYILGASAQADIYTGEIQSFWSLKGFTNLGIYGFNKVSPIDVSIPALSNAEIEALSYGVKRTSLTGNYTLNGEKISLTSEEKVELNVFYGKLNNKSISKLNNKKIEITTENGNTKEIYYKNADDKQKKAAIESVLSTNSRYSKIYILTSTGKYKYYASDSEYEELRKLGITKNVYRAIGTKKGFVKLN